MRQHVIFAAPFLMPATLRFLRGAARVPGVALSLVCQQPAAELPADLRELLDGHWRVDDALDAQQLVAAARGLTQQLGPPVRMIAALEQLQVPLAIAREALGIDGLSVAAAHNFRDKSRMKDVLRAADLPCAAHALVDSADAARRFIERVGFPVVVKPPAGAGGKATYRLESPADFDAWRRSFRPQTGQPTLFEEFVRGQEYSFDAVFIDGEPVWHSISSYHPTPLEVMENQWIQWCVLLPRTIDTAEFAPIREAGVAAVQALGLRTGLCHMEWFRKADGTIAISEVGARPPGAQICTLLSYAHDIDMYRAWPRLMIDGEFEPPERRYAVGAAYLRAQGGGRIDHVSGVDTIHRRYGELIVEADLPRHGQPTRDSYEGDGYVIVRHEQTAVVEQALRDIVETMQVRLA